MNRALLIGREPGADLGFVYTGAEPFDTVEYAAACGTDSTAIVQLFDLMLDELKEEGTLAAMLQEYSLD